MYLYIRILYVLCQQLYISFHAVAKNQCFLWPFVLLVNPSLLIIGFSMDADVQAFQKAVEELPFELRVGEG